MYKIGQKINDVATKFKSYWDLHAWPGTLLVFLVVFALYAIIYLPNPGINMLDDHLFHFKLAYLIRTQGWQVVKNFNWIAINPGQEGTYQLTLYNLMLIPFTYFKDMILGLKISDMFWGSLSVSMVYFAFRRFKMHHSLFWTFVLISLAFYIDRMLMGRALVLVPGLLMLELYFAKEKKYVKFFIVSILHVAWHTSTFFFPLTIAILIEVARTLDEKKQYWWNIPIAVAAFFIGVNLTLYTIRDLLSGVIGVQISTIRVAAATTVRVEGNELYPVDIFNMLSRSELILLILFVCFFVVFFYYVYAKKKSAAEKIDSGKEDNVVMYAAFLFALMAFAGSILASGRFYDFYFVAVVFLAGTVLTHTAKEAKVIVEPVMKKHIFIGVVVFLVVATTGSFLDRRQSIARTDYRPVGEVAAWIAGKSNENDRVFLSNWDYFPTAFFYNSKNVYTMGIEPRGALMVRPDLYWKWYNMYAYGIYCDRQEDCGSRKEIFDEMVAGATDEDKQKIQKINSAQIIDSIKNDFQSRFVLSAGTLSAVIKLNPDMIADQTSVKSDLNSGIADGFELK